MKLVIDDEIAKIKNFSLLNSVILYALSYTMKRPLNQLFDFLWVAVVCTNSIIINEFSNVIIFEFRISELLVLFSQFTPNHCLSRSQFVPYTCTGESVNSCHLKYVVQFFFLLRTIHRFVSFRLILDALHLPFSYALLQATERTKKNSIENISASNFGNAYQHIQYTFLVLCARHEKNSRTQTHI